MKKNESAYTNAEIRKLQKLAKAPNGRKFSSAKDFLAYVKSKKPTSRLESALKHVREKKLHSHKEVFGHPQPKRDT